MRAGRLRHRVTIEQKAVTRDSVGGQTVSWTTVAASLPAEVEPISGREFVELRAAQADISIRFRLRYRSGITPAMRVQWDGNAYGIVEAINVRGMNRELQLMCSGPAQES